MWVLLTVGYILAVGTIVYADDEESSKRWLGAMSKRIANIIEEARRYLPTRRQSPEADTVMERNMVRFVSNMRRLEKRLGDGIRSLPGNKKQLETVRQTLEKRTTDIAKDVSKRCTICHPYGKHHRANEVPLTKVARSGLDAMRTAAVGVIDGLKNSRGDVTGVAMDVYEEVVKATRGFNTLWS